MLCFFVCQIILNSQLVIIQLAIKNNIVVTILISFDKNNFLRQLKYIVHVLIVYLHNTYNCIHHIALQLIVMGTGVADVLMQLVVIALLIHSTHRMESVHFY